MIPHQQQLGINTTECNTTFCIENSTINNVTLAVEKSSEQDNYYVTFSIIMVIRFFGFLAVDSTNTLLDSCGLAIAKKEGADFGKQKMFTTCSMVIVPIICGRLIDLMSSYVGYIDYSMAFYLGAGFSVIASLIIFQLDIEIQQNKKSMLTTARAVIAMIDVDIFMLSQIVIGICWGLHMNFFSVYVGNELQGSKTLFGKFIGVYILKLYIILLKLVNNWVLYEGAALSIAGVGSVIVLLFAKTIISKFGEANSVSFALMCYSIRFIGYYFLQ